MEIHQFDFSGKCDIIILSKTTKRLGNMINKEMQFKYAEPRYTIHDGNADGVNAEPKKTVKYRNSIDEYAHAREDPQNFDICSILRKGILRHLHDAEQKEYRCLEIRSRSLDYDKCIQSAQEFIQKVVDFNAKNITIVVLGAQLQKRLELLKDDKYFPNYHCKKRIAFFEYCDAGGLDDFMNSVAEFNLNGADGIDG